MYHLCLVLYDAVRAVDGRSCFSVIGIDGKAVICNADNRIGRTPCLAAGGDVILLLRNEFVELGACRRVGRHVEYAIRVAEYALAHVGDGIAHVLGYIIVFKFLIFQGCIQQVMLLAALTGYFELIKGCMILAVAAQLVCAGVGMVMALKDDVNLVGVENRRELRAEQDTVRIGMVFAAAVNILVHDDDAPFRIRMGFDGLFDQG